MERSPSPARLTTRDVLLFLYLYPGRSLSWLPQPILDLIRRLADPIFQAMSGSRVAPLLTRLELAFGPEMPEQTRREVARKLVSAAVRRSIDDLVLERRRVSIPCRSFTGRDHLDAALAHGRGALLAGLHWQAGRVAVRHLASIGYPVLSIRNPEAPPLGSGTFGEKWLAPRYRSFLGSMFPDPVYVDDPDCSLKLLARLRSNGVVLILMDAAYAEHRMQLPFLGREREFAAGIFYLARAAGCPILPYFAQGGLGSLRIEIGAPMTVDRSRPLAEAWRAQLPVLAGILEEKVRAHPEEWELWKRL